MIKSFCEDIGFKYKNERLMRTRRGKNEGDLFPLDENKVFLEKAIFFEKNL